MNRKLRMGMVGGGQGAFIGGVHRMAAALDNEIDLVCGAFSSSPEKSFASGKKLYLPENRIYGSFEEMIRKEKELSKEIRMDFVSIVTPNHMHFAPAKMALENGFHVICDKPVCFSLEEAEELARIVEQTGLIFALTHNYTAYPMVKQAREMVKTNLLGKIRKVVVEYPQGWLATPLELTGQKQAAWRSDPTRSGIGGSLGDIGTHAANLAEYISSQEISEICADINIFVEGRLLDDDANVLLRFNKGAKGILHCSQISVGEENGLSIRIYGEKGGLEWHQQEPNSLRYRQLDKPLQVLRTGVGDLFEITQAHTRIPAGHPEGYLEAFANIYRNFAFRIKADSSERLVLAETHDFPTIEDGVRGMRFITRAVESGNSEQKWIKLAD
ncbi:Gfo/Idh/MocA family oxidoreductase [Labilibaculum sp. DW002]|uniref:Gfo/Idh/MocA family oxidoreductase n=1 Tax=Paralabilibaculum antarcticum TaxID=2912572 RepID=A0ABT5VPI4_9BACT|nr:Gfo/Idh/MocA family oxidoreductase [Labilibaculum sp. DW002]MDE5417333.1 Gfo/Idh/MocA family oxidoreductase [Labilibaculum sp. DW002]